MVYILINAWFQIICDKSIRNQALIQRVVYFLIMQDKSTYTYLQHTF